MSASQVPCAWKVWLGSPSSQSTSQNPVTNLNYSLESIRFAGAKLLHQKKMYHNRMCDDV